MRRGAIGTLRSYQPSEQERNEHAIPQALPRALRVAPASRSFVDRVLERLLRISLEEASFARRGFPAASAAAREHLENVGRCFLRGYNEGLAAHHPSELIDRLDLVEPVNRGFALEGAAMALAILDYITPWHHERFDQLLLECAEQHPYMARIGAGWAVARLRRPFHRSPASSDVLLGWLVADGMGFHEGYFKWSRFVLKCERPAKLRGYALRAFDQGIGRSLWFVGGADPQRIRSFADAFDLSRRADLWSGIGLAATYAGGTTVENLRLLRKLSGANASALAQGAVFAAKARHRAGNIESQTDDACHILCEMNARTASQFADDILTALPTPHTAFSYENWRLAIQERFASIPAIV